MDIDKNFFISKGGLDRRWIFGSELNYNLSCDYMQKLNYDYEDYVEYKNPRNIKGRKDVYYMVQVAVWIMDTCEAFEKLITPILLKDFTYSKVDTLREAHKYLTALRSALVAHPLITDRHPKYGFDGDFIAIDIGYPKQQTVYKIFKCRAARIGLSGILNVDSIEDCDFCIVGYRKNKGAEFYEHIGFMKQDIDICVELYKQRMYELDKYLKNKKKKDWL